jgi:hypothetical protein
MPRTNKPREAVEGAYLLANDVVLDWALAFLESFRESNPSLPLIVIPFDERISHLRTYRGHYDFTFLDADLEKYDRIGAAFYGKIQNTTRLYRKFSVVEGPFQRFALFDADIVWLRDLEPFFAYLRAGLADAVIFHREGPYNFRGPHMHDFVAACSPGFAEGYNIGFVAGRRDLFSLELLRGLAARGRHLGRHLIQCDQALMNLCLALSGARVATADDVDPHLVPQDGKALGWRFEAPNTYRCANGPHAGKVAGFLHWVGVKQPDATMPNHAIFDRYRQRAGGIGHLHAAGQP